MLAFVIAAAAPFVALAYGDDRLLALTLAVSYLPVAFSLQAPTWIFFRRMDFLRQRVLQAIVPVVTFAVTVPLAIAGVGVWSLVIGPFVANATAPWPRSASRPIRCGSGATAQRGRATCASRGRSSSASCALLVVLQGQVLAFDLAEGLAAAGFITLAATLTRYADRVDRILASTIYPAICAVQDRPRDAGRAVRRSRTGSGSCGSSPFCAGLVLFAPDLVEFVLGDEWEPAVGLLQGMAVAAGLQQLGYNWFSFYRAAGNPRPQAVESVVMVGSFLLLAVPGLFAWGFDGFVGGRIAGVGARCSRSGGTTSARSCRASAWCGSARARSCRSRVPSRCVVAVRLALWGDRDAVQAAAEIVLFVAATTALTWTFERGLLRETGGYLRRRRRRRPCRPPSYSTNSVASRHTW